MYSTLGRCPARMTTSWTRVWRSTWPRWGADGCCARSGWGWWPWARPPAAPRRRRRARPRRAAKSRTKPPAPTPVTDPMGQRAAERHRPQRHPVEFGSERHRGGRPDDAATDPPESRAVASRSAASRSTCGTAPGRASTHVFPRVENQNFLRGVQVADAGGSVRYTSVFPGLLLRALAARPLRGLPQPGGIADAATPSPPAGRAAPARLREVYASAATRRPWATSPGSAWPPTTSSATTAAHSSSPRPPAT